jgi:hypothetical protein
VSEAAYAPRDNAYAPRDKERPAVGVDAGPVHELVSNHVSRREVSIVTDPSLCTRRGGVRNRRHGAPLLLDAYHEDLLAVRARQNLAGEDSAPVHGVSREPLGLSARRVVRDCGHPRVGRRGARVGVDPLISSPVTNTILPVETTSTPWS